MVKGAREQYEGKDEKKRQKKVRESGSSNFIDVFFLRNMAKCCGIVNKEPSVQADACLSRYAEQPNRRI